MMPVEYGADALDFLKKLPKHTKKRILSKIESAAENPSHFLERLSGRPEYKIRSGNYRIIVDLIDNRLLIRVIGHGKNIYDKL